MEFGFTFGDKVVFEIRTLTEVTEPNSLLPGPKTHAVQLAANGFKMVPHLLLRS